jgi:ELMO/CED-12 family
MSSSLIKSLTTNQTSNSTANPTPTDLTTRRLYKISIPKITTFINNPSEFVSGIIDYAEVLWDKTRTQVEIPGQEENLSRSSSVVFENSPDILIVNRHKPHGRQETFSKEFAINPKKLRAGRYSEHIPRKCLKLQIDEDVQPKITTMRESTVLIQRKRTESCYPRFQNNRSSNNNLLSVPSVEFRIDDKSYETVNKSYESKFETALNEPGRSSNSKLIQYIQSYRNQSSDRIDRSKSLEIERPDVEKVDKANASCIEEINTETISMYISQAIMINRSTESIAVSIDGKIFTYFNKSQLCGIPVCTFKEFLDRLKDFDTGDLDIWRKSRLIDGLCCNKTLKINSADQDDLEKIIKLSLIPYEYSNELHLILLLSVYTSITGQTDWPNRDIEWLNIGFSSTDLDKELKKGGLIGLLFTFFLSTYFSKFFKEMLDVSTYYSFEVFQVCKQFGLDAVNLLRDRKLHRLFRAKTKALETFLYFYTGMVIDWFVMVVKNKDFDEVYEIVINKAKNSPSKFLAIAEEKYNYECKINMQ